HRLLGGVELDGCSDFVGTFAAPDRKAGKLLQEFNPQVQRALPDVARAFRIPIQIAERLAPVPHSFRAPNQIADRLGPFAHLSPASTNAQIMAPSITNVKSHFASGGKSSC